MPTMCGTSNLQLILCGAFIHIEIYITLQLYGVYLILNYELLVLTLKFTTFIQYLQFHSQRFHVL